MSLASLWQCFKISKRCVALCQCALGADLSTACIGFPGEMMAQLCVSFVPWTTSRGADRATDTGLAEQTCFILVHWVCARLQSSSPLLLHHIAACIVVHARSDEAFCALAFGTAVEQQQQMKAVLLHH